MIKWNVRFILWAIAIFAECSRNLIFAEGGLPLAIYDLVFLAVFFIILCVAVKKDGIRKNILCVLYFLYDIWPTVFYVVYFSQPDIRSQLSVAQYEYEMLCISGVFATLFISWIVIKLGLFIKNYIKSIRVDKDKNVECSDVN